MKDWKQLVRFDESKGLGADVSLDFLQAKSPVRLAFDQSGDIKELTPEAEASMEAVLQRLPSLEKLVTATAFDHYRMFCEELGDTQCQELGIPLVGDESALLPYYQLFAIYLPEEPKLGRFGLGFNCDWEEEHGFGLQFRNWQIVEVGGDAEAFSFYD